MSFLLFSAIGCLVVVIGLIILYKLIVNTTIGSPDYRRNLFFYGITLILSFVPWAVRSYQANLCAGSGHTLPCYLAAATFVGTKWLSMAWFYNSNRLNVGLIGVSTVIAMILSVIVTAAYAGRIKVRMIPNLKSGMNFEILRLIGIIGIPVFVVNLLWSFDSSILLHFITPYGPMALASLGAVDRVRRTALIPALATSVGLCIFVAQQLGAQDLGKAKHAFRISGAMVFSLYGILAAPFAIAMPKIVHLFAPMGPEAETLSSSILQAEILVYPLLGLTFVAQGTFEGLGKTYPNLVTLFLVLVFGRILPLSLFLHGHGLSMLRWVFPWSHMLHAIELLWLLWYWRKWVKAEIPQDNSLSKCATA